MTDARAITFSLGGRWHNRYGVAPCPVCQREKRRDQAALTLADGRDGRLLAHCKKSECAFADILAAAGLRSGDYRPPDPAIIAQREAGRRAEVEKRARLARAVWDEAQPIGGTVAEAYLRHRGITCPLPETLRYAPSCWHVSAKRLPAMIALVEGGDSFAVHRTYLRADGSGKAEVEPVKAMLGSTQGGAVRLTGGPGRLVVAEGIESALSLMCGLLDGPATVLAALSTSGIRGLRLPAQPGRLSIAPDGDRAGREAGMLLAERAHRLGWRIGTADPGDGLDWNDILIRRAEAA